MQNMTDPAVRSPPSGSDANTLCCSLCHRIFDKQSTFKRHGYYCRSRPLHQRQSRKRACSACVLAKARCDSQTPSCSRCRLRSSECIYHGFVSSEMSPDGALVNSSTQNVPAVSETSNIIQGRSEAASNPLPTVGFPADSGSDGFDWDALNELDFIPSLHQGSSLVNEDWDVSMMSTSTRTFTSESFNQMNASSNFDLLDFQLLAHPPSTSWSMNQPSSPRQDANAIVSIPSLLSANHLLRSFTPKTTIKVGSRVSAMLLIQILKSYPKMMTREETLPPFIHPCCILDSNFDESSPMLEPLANCMTLAKLFYSDTGHRKLLWKMIRMEQERLIQEHPNFDQWELLAAVQAVMIYILMRLVEGPTENTNFDAQLLATLPFLARAFESILDGCGKADVHPVPLHSYSWKDWIFHESRRRTFTIFRLLFMIFDLAPASMCTPAHGFFLMPLPASKLLWEAHDAETWHAEAEMGTQTNGTFGLLPDGQLMRLVRFSGWEKEKQMPTDMHGENHSNEIWKSGENWTDWAAGMDAFGYLIMVAASLVGVNEH